LRGTTLSGSTLVHLECPKCGYVKTSGGEPILNNLFRPWHVRGRKAVKSYLESLGTEAREWLLALYVDKDLQLLAVDTIAQGDISGCKVNFAHILCRGHRLKAAGFILAHNHPSGDATPSDSDIRTTVRLAHAARELDMPLLNHVIIAGDQMTSVGEF
jgi:DNA repair protein RadC